MTKTIQTDLTIRPLRAADRLDWRALWTSYLDFYETTISEDVYETAFERLLSGEAGEFNCLLAEVDGTLVGLVHYLFHRHLWSIDDRCYLMDLYVKPDVGGSGAGRALIETVHRVAKENNIPCTYWMTQDFNYKGRILYDQVATKTPFIKYVKND
ncbi:GNAT family N-acetyltransferase [uncultured Ruegeria sp.]|uniref:GNAT family N-acetyltransferase n=1 Tax=uncultured Ruegeria sp. TaxID=259304 RepID=UPI00260232BF|nr:GNAT family N-acetyltransferase [uncultured Ruegeria sp.]